MNQPDTVNLSLDKYNELYDFKQTMQLKGLVIETPRDTFYYTGDEAFKRLVENIQECETHIERLQNELTELKNKKRTWF